MSHNSAQPDARVRQPKPLRFKIGVGLLILYPFLYLVIPIAPFLAIEVSAKVALVAGVLAAAEGILLLGVACVGKEAYRAIKARLGLGKKKSREAPQAAQLGDAAPDSLNGSAAAPDPTPESDNRRSKEEHA